MTLKKWLGIGSAALLLGVPGGAMAQSASLRETERFDPRSGSWKVSEPEPAGSPIAELRRAKDLLIEGRPDDAQDVLKTWLKNNANHAQRYEAEFLLGEAHFDDKNFYAAFEQYEVVIANSAGDLYRKALTREMDVARAFLAGEKRRAWKVVKLPAYDDGIEILDKIWERAPGTRLGEEALLLKAQYFYEVGDADLAQDEYALLAQEYPNGRYKQVAMLRSAESAERAFPGIRFDDRALLNADERYRQVEERFPEYADREQVPARRKGIRDQRAAKELDIAEWYRKTENHTAAEFYYKAILRDWPDTFAATEARTRLLGMGVDVGPEPEGAKLP